MKLKHHLWGALVIIIVALFLTSVVSKTDAVLVPGVVEVHSDSETTVWNLMWENLFTNIPTDDSIEDIGAFGIVGDPAAAMVDEHGTGNSFVSGLLGLIPVLSVIAGILLTTVVKVKKEFLYIPFALVFVSVVTLWFTAPSKLNGVESLYNTIMTPLGTLMKDGTVFSMGIGFFVLLVGSLYGIVALVLNKMEIIEE